MANPDKIKNKETFIQLLQAVNTNNRNYHQEIYKVKIKLKKVCKIIKNINNVQEKKEKKKRKRQEIIYTVYTVVPLHTTLTRSRIEFVSTMNFPHKK